MMREDEYAILYHHVRGKNIARMRFVPRFAPTLLPLDSDMLNPPPDLQ
jgi:hypothetical protein